MSSNDKQSSSGTPTRKQRREAERAARKGGKSSKSPSTGKASVGRQGPSMVIISIAAIAIGVVLVGALLVLTGGLGNDDATAIAKPDTPAPAAELRDGNTLVAPGATPAVEIELFEDAQCPHCQTFTERVEPLIIAEHVADGTASLTYSDFIIFGEPSFDAAVAMRAADELGGAFWDYHHTLFYNAGDGAFTRSWLADIAESVGLDRDAFSELLDDEELRAAVTESTARGASYGIGSTPSVMVNGELLVAPTWDDIDAAIVAAGEAAGTSGTTEDAG
jgi:protein-disulfide isomerase